MTISAVSLDRFSGFRPEAFAFLRELRCNNDREWFAARRDRYDTLILSPARDLVAEIGPLLRRRIAPEMRAEPRVGGSILRMQKDSRFARGSPFRPHLELWFWEGDGPSREHPGFFTRLTGERLVLGAGMTTFAPQRLRRYRASVDEPRSGRELAALLHQLQADGWQLVGPCRRRVPRPHSGDHERHALLRRLSIRVERSEPLPEAVFAPELIGLLLTGFARLRPLHRWLVRWT